MYKFTCMFILILINKSYMDVGCLQGWRISENGQYCTVNCVDPHSNQWNVYCKTAPAYLGIAIYNSTSNSFIMPIGKGLSTNRSNFSNCFNVSLASSWRKTKEFLNVSGYYLPLTSNVNRHTLCYPMSPQLLNCETLRTNYKDYHMEDGTTVIIANKNITAQLGDFQIDRNRAAITCSKQIKDTLFESPRCNYFVMYTHQYRINDDGSLFLPRANFTINNPSYSIVIGHLTFVCVPLAIDYLSCPTKKLFESRDFIFGRHMEAINYLVFEAVKPNQYFVNDVQQLTQCEANLNIWTFIGQFLISASFVSNICLLMTLLMQCKMFTQKDTHTHCMFNHIISMAVSNTMFTTQRFLTINSVLMAYTVFFFDYYFTIAASLWLNALAYDTWRYFSRMNIISTRVQRSWVSKDFRRYLCYNMYCWGVALLLTSFSIMIDFIPWICDATFGYCPHIKVVCWFNNVDSFLLYFCLPFNFLTLSNFIFLILITRTVHLASIGTELVNNRRKRQIFLITARLYILTGFYYTIILACNITIAIENKYMMNTWFIASGSFFAQGIAIFAIYFSKKDTFDIVKSIIKRSTSN